LPSFLPRECENFDGTFLSLALFLPIARGEINFIAQT